MIVAYGGPGVGSGGFANGAVRLATSLSSSELAGVEPGGKCRHRASKAGHATCLVKARKGGRTGGRLGPVAGRRVAFSSGAAPVVAPGASSEPRQSANALNEVALVQPAHGAAPRGRPCGLRSVGRPPSARSSPGRDPRRVALLPATPRVWSWFSDRPPQRGPTATTAEDEDPARDEEGFPVRPQTSVITASAAQAPSGRAPPEGRP